MKQICFNIWWYIFFWRAKKYLINIVNEKNRLEFSVENLSQKENLTLHLTKLSDKTADIVDKKIHEFEIICTKFLRELKIKE